LRTSGTSAEDSLTENALMIIDGKGRWCWQGTFGFINSRLAVRPYG